MSHRPVEAILCLCIVIFCVMLCGCSSYTVPGRGANLAVIAAETPDRADPGGTNGSASPQETGGDIEIIQRKPVAPFPAHVVVVRIQEPDYRSMTNEGVGSGNYSVVTVRDIETDEDFERLGRLPSLAQISPLSKLLLPTSLQSDQELRQAAARLQAGMVLLYTVDTAFLDTDKSTVLSVVTLGFGPTIDVRVITTVSGLLLDTQTGYVYGTIEETAREQATTGALDTHSACDQLRLKTERRAFESFIAEFETLWPRVVDTYAK